MEKYSVKKPFTVLVAVVIILVTGAVSFVKMTPDLFPSIDMPYVMVLTPYPGETPEKVESNVTKPLEQTLATLEDIKTVQSVSHGDYSMVMLEFENSVNMDTISSDIAQKINLIEGDWEEQVGTPTVLKLNPNMIPVEVVAVDYEGKDTKGLSDFVENTLSNKLESVNGVARIDSSGVLTKQLNVVISEKKIEKLNALGVGNLITSEMISGILKGQNFSMPAGYVQDDGAKYLVSVGDAIKSKKEVMNLCLLDMGPVGGKIYLKDVADVFTSDNSEEVYARINGKPGVVVSFSKQSNYAIADVCRNLQDRFDSLEKEYKGLTFTPMMSQGDYINLVVSSIISSLLWGALFAILILLLFLRGIKPTLITICSIPISLVFAFVMMYFSGVTINLISMSGLAVSVGMLVDNSVVVLENTVRLRRQGVPASKAAVAGAKQVAGAITASTLTTVCVFLPIVFTEGLTRKLFTDMALTVAYTLIASLIIALTVVPAMSSRLLSNSKERESNSFIKLLDRYSRSIEFVLNHKAPILIITVLLLAGSVVISVNKGFTFMPDMNSPQMQVTMEMPKGSNMDATVKMADQVTKKIEEVDGVETVGGIYQSNNFMNGSGGRTTVSFYVMLKEDRKLTSAQVAEEVNRKCENMECTVTASGGSMDDYTAAFGGSGVEIKVLNTDLDKLQAAAEKVGKALVNVKGIDQVNNGIEDSDKEYHFVVNKDKAVARGLTVAQVYSGIVDRMKTEENATSVTWNSKTTEVMVSAERKSIVTMKKLKDMTIQVEDSAGDKVSVRVNDVADLQEKSTLKAINRENQSRYLKVSGTLKKGYNVTKVTDAVKKEVGDIKLPAGTTLEYAGENQTIMDAMEDLVLMLLLGLLLVYLIMVAQFQSLKSPFIIMFTIPLAFTGGLLALIITGKEISVISMIGMIMLTGIIVNNGIVLVDYINQLRGKGYKKRDAIIEAGRTRLRPIMMTATTTILGLSVMALGKSAGTDLMQPVALVCIGGLVYATLLTLYIVPVMYDIMHREEYKQLKEEDLDISNIQ